MSNPQARSFVRRAPVAALLFAALLIACGDPTDAKRDLELERDAVTASGRKRPPKSPAPTEPAPTEPAPTEPAPTEPSPTEPPPGSGATVTPDQLQASFDSSAAMPFGNLTASTLETAFGGRFDWSVGLSDVELVNELEGRSLRQRYVPNAQGTPVVSFPLGITGGMEVWLSYRVYFEPGWQWVKGGKLPGLAGGTYPTGGAYDDDGFSARLMWRGNGQVSLYAYHHDRPSVYGEDFYLSNADGARWTAPVGKWFTVRERIKMNTTGSTTDGEVEVWIDGERKLLKTGLRWRKNTSYTADTFLYSSFYGGGDPSWSPSTTTYARFDDFKIASVAQGVD